MAKELYNGPLNKDMDFTNPVGDGRPASGLAVQNYIKEIDEKSLSKMRCGYTRELNGVSVHLFFASEEDMAAYQADPDNPELQDLILDRIELESMYRMEIYLLSDVNNVIFLGDTGNIIRYTFKTFNKNDVEISEAVTATYAITNGTTTRTVVEKYNARATAEFNIDKYLLQGRNDILITLEGQTTKSSTSASVAYQVVNLQLTDTMDISKVYRPNTGLASDIQLSVPYTVSGSGYKVMEWWIDGEKLAFDRHDDEINEATSSRTKYINIIGLSQGRHSVQFRVSILINGQTYYSNIHYREFIVSLDQAGDPIIVTATDFPVDASILGPSDSLVIYPNQYEAYSLRLGVYNPNGTYQNTVIASVAGTTVASVTCLTGQESEVSVTFTEAGAQNLVLSIDEYNREISMDVTETELDIHEITNALQMNFTGEGKNNDSPSKDTWTGSVTQPGGTVITHTATLHGFEWTDVSGWVDNQLIIPSGAHIDFTDFAPLANNPTGTGVTIEMEFKTINVENEDAVLIDLTDNNTGASIKLTSTEIFVKSSESWTLSRRYKTDEDLRISIVINPKTGDTYAGMVFVYFNGILSMVQNYSNTASFASATNLSIGGVGAGIKVRQVRIYNSALNPDNIVNNFILYRPTSQQMLAAYQRNDLYDTFGSGFDLNKIAAFLPVMIITGDITDIENATTTKAKVKVDIDYTNLQNPEYSFKIKNAQMRPQGTSSLAYPRKNLRLYTKQYDDTILYDADGNVVVDNLYAFKPGAQRVKCWTLKADFAESSSTHNTGVARLWNDVMTQARVNDEYVLRTEAQQIAIDHNYPYDVRTTVDGFPIVIFQRDNESSPLVFLGKYNFNNDKSSESVFGFTDIKSPDKNPGDPGYWEFDNSHVNCWEFRDSGYSLALFKTPNTGRTYEQEFDYYATTMEDGKWKMNEIWESRYPDVNNLTTDVSQLKRLALWINSTEGAAIWDTTPSSPTYNTLVIGDQTKFNKWQTEKSQYFDLYKLAAYYVYLIRFGAVDQTVKNAMMTTEDGNHWYFINYDNDTILGVRNDGLLKYDPYIDRTTWDPTAGGSGGYAYAGHESVLWNNFEADPECMNMVRIIDSALYNAGLKYNDMIEMFNVEQAGKWAEKVYNNDASYKYIEPWIYESRTFLGSLQGSRSDHRKWWISNRFSTYDAIYGNAAYEDNAVFLLIPGAPNTATFTIESGKDTYYGWGQNRVPVEIGAYVEQGHNHTFTLAGGYDAWQLGTPLRIYAPNYIKTLDLSASMQWIGGQTFDMSAAYSDTLGSKMKSLILGVDNIVSDTRRNVSLQNIGTVNNILTLENLNVAGFEAMGSLTIDHLSNLKTFRAWASGLNNVTFANGAPLTNIELPVAIQALTFNSLPNLTVSGINLEPYYPSDITDPDYGKRGKNIRTIDIHNCPNISNSPSLIFDWFENKTVADNQCSVYMDNVAWGDDVPMTESDMQKLIDFVDNGGSLELIGHARIGQIDDPEFAEELRRVFGEHVFEPTSQFYIIAPPSIFITGPSSVVEGHTAQYDIIIIGETATPQITYSLINAGSRASISNNGLLTTVENGSADQTIIVRAIIDFGSGVPEIRDKNVQILQCVYPDDVTLTGNNRLIPGTPSVYVVSYQDEESYTGEMIAEWEVTGDMATYNYVTITSTSTDSYGNPSGCTLLMTAPPEGVVIVTGKLSLKLRKKNHSSHTTVVSKSLDLVFQDDSIAVTRATNPYAMEALYNGLHSKGKCEHAEYMTKQEAYAVTSDDLMTASGSTVSIFYNNSNFRTKCTSFDEFQYFIAVGELNNTFYNCNALQSVIIPAGVRTIGNYAFSNCTELISINIPNGVTSIGQRAFNQCRNLTGTLVIPEGVTSIGINAFLDCTGLTSVSLPNTLTIINNGAFHGCTGLTGALIIPEGVTTIGTQTFYNCTSLTSVSLPSTITTIGAGTSSGQSTAAFYGCAGLTEVEFYCNVLNYILCISSTSSPFYQCSNINSVILHEGITSIGNSAFQNCTWLTSIDLPSTVTTIGVQSFYGCTGLTGELVIPEGVTSIGQRAFYNCIGLTSVSLPSTLITISGTSSDAPFYNCNGLTEVEFYCNVPNYALRANSASSPFYLCNNINSVILHEGVTSIGTQSFYNCTWLTSIDLPSTVTTIGVQSFYGCTGLTGELVIPEGVTTIEYQSFYNCNKLTSISFPSTLRTINSGAFMDCTGLTGELVIPEGVTTIECYGSSYTGVAGYGAFRGCTGLTSVVLPNTLTNWIVSSGSYSSDWVYRNVFYGCTGLTKVEFYCSRIPFKVLDLSFIFCPFSGCTNISSVILHEGITSINGYAFQNCTATINSNLPSTITLIGDHAFYNCTGLTGELVIPEGVTTISQYAFYNCTGLTGELVIPEGVTTIGSYAFYGCTGLTGLVISEGVITIDTQSFEGCTGLTGELVIPEGVTTIGSYTFRGCTDLTSVSLPSTVATIGVRVFDNCTGLTEVEFYCDVPDNALNTSASGSLFYQCDNINSVILQEGITSIGGSAFSGCTAIVNATLPSTVTTIGGNAFKDCTGLTGDLVIPEGVSTIANNTFYNCASLTSISIPSTVTSITDNAFNYVGSESSTNGLDYITVHSDNQYFNDGNGSNCLIRTSNNILLLGCNHTIIPSTVTAISGLAFYKLGGLTSITIPANVLTIDSSSFYSCYALEHIYVDSNNTVFTDDNLDYIKKISDGNLILGCKNSIITALVHGINDYAFRGCIGLTSIVLRNTSNISSYAFQDCTGLTSVEFDISSSSSIGSYAFRRCTNLNNITFTRGISTIGVGAFEKCSSLTSVFIPTSVATIGTNPFSYCTSLSSITIDANNSYFSDGDGCNCIIRKSDGYLISGCKNTIIPSSVRTINQYAFDACTGLTSITIPNTVTIIDSYAFQYCTGLTSISFPNTITTIGSKAFSGCTELTEVEFYCNIQSYAFYISNANSPFYGCSKINSIILHEGITSIGQNAFWDCTATINPNLPSTLTLIGQSAFQSCTGLIGDLIIPEGITGLSYGTFQSCTGLTSAILPSTLTSMASGIFNNCTNLAIITSKPLVPPSIQDSSLPSISTLQHIYVPSESVSDYQNASNWNAYSIRISAITE